MIPDASHSAARAAQRKKALRRSVDLGRSRTTPGVRLASARPQRKDHTMKYMMFVVSSLEPDTEPDQSDVDLWVDPLDASGKRIIGEVLAPVSDSTVVKVR